MEDHLPIFLRRLNTPPTQRERCLGILRQSSVLHVVARTQESPLATRHVRIAIGSWFRVCGFHGKGSFWKKHRLVELARKEILWAQGHSEASRASSYYLGMNFCKGSLLPLFSSSIETISRYRCKNRIPFLVRRQLNPSLPLTLTSRPTCSRYSRQEDNLLKSETSELNMLILPPISLLGDLRISVRTSKNLPFWMFDLLCNKRCRNFQ